MNFKTPFKVLTTAALIGTLSLSAVAPGVASAADKTVTAQAETPANFAIEKVILVKGDSKISVSFDTYIDALGNKTALNGYELAYVVAANGEVFALDTYVDFYEAGNTEEEVVEKLSKAGKTSEVTEVKDGAFNDGKLEPVEPAVIDPKVESVTAINSKQIKVTFNKEIPADQLLSNVSAGIVDTDAITVARTAAATDDPNKNVSTVTGEVSEDGKSIILTADATASEYFDGTYAVTVSDKVEDKTGKKLTAFAGTVKVEDTVAPTVESVEFDPTSGNIVFTTSEPVKLPTTLRINGTPVTGLAAVANSNNTKFEVAKPESVKAGEEATIYLAGSKDFAGNILEAFNGKVKIVDDQSELKVAEVKQVSSNKAAIVFNKPLKASTLADTDFTALIDGKTLTATTNISYSIDSTDKTGKTVIAEIKGGTTGIAAAPAYFYGTGTAKDITFVIADKAIEDVYGQKVATTTKTVSMTKDVTGPVATDAKVSKDGKSIIIQLDEELTGSAGSSVTLNAVRVNGVDKATDYTAELQKDTGNKVTQIKVALSSGTELPAGTIQVRFAAGAITDTHTNESKIISQTVNVDAVSGDLKVAKIDNASGANHFTVEYNKAVTAATALNADNYKLDGKALPEGTDIYFDTTDTTTKVHIVLPDESINIGEVGTGSPAQLSVSGVKTQDGKTVIATSDTVNVEDNTSATIKSVSVTGNIIYVKFDEKLAGTLENDAQDDFVINIDGEALNVGTEGETDGEAGEVTSEIVSGQEDTVAITVKPATKGASPFDEYVASNWNNAKKIEVSYKGTGLTDANLFTVAASKAPVANK